jgi:GcrA cell cycle regulator
MSATMETYDWNDEAISRLRSLWHEGHTTAEIGRRLGVSKSAIIGKAHRLGLPARPSPIRQPNQTGPRPPQQRAPVPKLAEMMPVPSGAPTAGMPDTTARPDPHPQQPAPPARSAGPGTSKTCCWPIGHPGTPGFRFCDKPAPAAKPYCTEHAGLAYRPPARRDAPTPSRAQAD